MSLFLYTVPMRIYTPSDIRKVPEHATCVFKGAIYDTYQWEQELYDGTTTTFERLKRPDTVEVICVDGDQILVSKEEQPDTDEFYTVPGGRHDVDAESELDAAKREIREELGYTFKHWKLLHVKQPDMKIERLTYLFLATEVEHIDEQQLDPGEKIEVMKMSFQEFKALETHPKMCHFPSIVFDDLNSMADLLALPSLHSYQ